MFGGVGALGVFIAGTDVAVGVCAFAVLEFVDADSAHLG